MSESDREERIRQRAFERYQQRGSEDGRDFEDWLEAEREENDFFDSTKHPPVDIPEAPHRDDAGTPPGRTSEAAPGGKPGRGIVREDAPSEGPASSMPGKASGDNHGKDDKINEAAEESFPASDAPAWRGGSAN